MVREWRYGDAGDRYPVKPGDVWQVGPHLLACQDLETGGPDRFLLYALRRAGRPALVYVDPPWNQGNVNAFRTKAGVGRATLSFPEFLNRLIGLIRRSGAGLAFIEMGHQEEGTLQRAILAHQGRPLARWRITYYRRNPCLLVAAAWSGIDALPEPDVDPTGMDDDYTPDWAIRNYTSPGDLVFDPCTGRGLTAVTADQHGRRFIGAELHPRRLANAIDRLVKQGGYTPRVVARL